MKKIFQSFLLFIVSCIFIIGCANTQNLDQENETIHNNKKIMLKIYHANMNADGLDIKEIVLTELTPKILFEKLAENGVISKESQIINFKIYNLDGEDVIELDISQSFNDYLNSLGSSGERLSIQGLCNTFLKAYNCKKIHITIEGRMLATGHKEYPGYMGFFNN